MLDKGTCLRFYKRKDIQNALVQHGHDKEVAVRYGPGFGKRPDILAYPQDVMELALRNATSFHASEELWNNPLALSSSLKKKDLEELRTGWDLVLDIDCLVMEYSRICADMVIKFLQYNGVKAISCKFSGNKGFHIGVPFTAFPSQVGGEETRKLFPDAARKIAAYITHHIKEELTRRILEFENFDISIIKEKVGEDIIIYEVVNGSKIPKLNIDSFLEIDTVLISSRHLYRMPYSLHEKSGLVSLPLEPDKVMLFEKPMAHPDKLLDASLQFMPREVEESGRRLLTRALDFDVELRKKEDKKKEDEFQDIKFENPLQEEFFPPCMKHVLKGMEDGKKRALFILINFLGKIGWSKPQVEAYLFKWNRSNPEPLRENYIRGQLSSFTPGVKLPPNCNNESYYTGLDICHPDSLCKRIKNPVNYTIIRWRKWLQDKEENDKLEEKERKRLEREAMQTKRSEKFRKSLSQDEDSQEIDDKIDGKEITGSPK